MSCLLSPLEYHTPLRPLPNLAPKIIPNCTCYAHRQADQTEQALLWLYQAHKQNVHKKSIYAKHQWFWDGEPAPSTLSLSITEVHLINPAMAHQPINGFI